MLEKQAQHLELEGREAKQLVFHSTEVGINKTTGKGAQALSLWKWLLSNMKERYSFKEDVMPPRQVDHHGWRQPLSEAISHAGGDLWWCGQQAVTQRPRGSQVYTTHVVEVCVGCTIVIHQLIGSNDLERWRGTNCGQNWPTPIIQTKCFFLATGLYPGCGHGRQMHPFPHLYRPVSLPAIRSKHKQHRPPCVTTERTWGSGMEKSTLTLEAWVGKWQGKSQERVIAGYCYSSQSSRQSRVATLTPDLQGTLTHIYKKWMNSECYSRD